MTTDATSDGVVSTRRVTRDDLDTFAALSGDHNPIHVDPAFAATTPFEVPVAHGMFLYGLVRSRVRHLLPNAVEQSQHMTFRAPTPAGADVTIRVHATDRAPDGTTRVATAVTHDGGTGLDGHATWGADRTATTERDDPIRADDADTPPSEPDDERSHGDRARPSAAWWEDVVGRRATTSSTFTIADLHRYAELVDAPEVPTDTGSVPTPLAAGMVSRLLGVDLPGPGTNWLRLAVRWHHPVPIDRRLRATVTVTRARPRKRLVDLATHWVTDDGTRLGTGDVLVLARGIPAPGSPPTS